jgi:hypothetical protein
MSAARIKSAWSMPDELWMAPAYRKLSLGERVLIGELLAMAKQYGTDEPIIFSAEMAAFACNVPRSVAARSLMGLRKKGFIVLMKAGDQQRSTRGRMANEWRLTFLPSRTMPPPTIIAPPTTRRSPPTSTRTSPSSLLTWNEACPFMSSLRMPLRKNMTYAMRRSLAGALAASLLVYR